MEVVQSFGMPLVNCPSFTCILWCWQQHRSVYFFSFVSSLIPLRSQILPDSWPNAALALAILALTSIINVHNSRQCASKVCELVYHLQSLTLHSLFVLRFYGPVNPMGSCRARSVYLTTRLLGRLSPLSG